MNINQNNVISAKNYSLGKNVQVCLNLGHKLGLVGYQNPSYYIWSSKDEAVFSWKYATTYVQIRMQKI